jgi:hypothetical protein
MRERSLIIASILVAALFIGGAFLYHRRANSGTVRAPISRTNGSPRSSTHPVLGAEGSEHSHASFLLFIRDDAIDFNQSKYMLRDKLAHFENADGITLHKHATGVTAPYFLSTLGIRLTSGCITLEDNTAHCNEGDQTVSIIVNNAEISDFDSYEVQDGDKILINYGADDDIRLRLKANHIPDMPEEFQKPF